MPVCPPREKLLELLDETLEEPDLQKISGHVGDCRGCQEVLETLTGPDELLRTSVDGLPSVSIAEFPLPASLLKRLRYSSNGFRETKSAETATNSRFVFPGKAGGDAPLGTLDCYNIIERLGSGASGVLFKARDTRLDRTVAIKILKQDLSTSETARLRFAREARAAAGLFDERIVTIHEVDEPRDFPPFLVMEYVDGESLRERLDRESIPDQREAVRLVIAIARGLGVAHQAGVVHRDIKPSNIMIEGQTGRVKITDFGLARVSENAVDLTLEGTITGTPSYMSPEQIVNPQVVDGRSDIYSLGVMLYELLVGEVPFRGLVRRVLMQTLHDEPISPRHLNDSVARDLETICLKAISKEPRQRYETADEFADDLTRWLEKRPVLARPVGPADRVWRWCRRNPRIASLSSALLLTLVCGVVGWLCLTVSLSRARATAVTAQASSERNARSAAEQRDLVLTALRKMVFEVQNELQDAPGTQRLRQSLLGIALEGLDQVENAVDRAGLVSLSTAVAENRMGESFRELGKIDQAKEHFQKAVRILHDLSRDHPRDLAVQQCLAYTLWDFGDLNADSGEMKTAEKQFSDAFGISRKLLNKRPSSREAQRGFAIACDRVGDLRKRDGQPQQARKLYEQGLVVMQALAKSSSSHDGYGSRRDLAVAHLKLGTVCLSLGKLDVAEEHLRNGHRLSRELSAAQPGNFKNQHDLAISHLRVADFALRVKSLREASRHLEEAQRILATLATRDPQHVAVTRNLIQTRMKLGQFALMQKTPADAYIAFQSALELAEKLVQKSGTESKDHKTLKQCHRNLAVAEFALGKRDAAKDRLRYLKSLEEQQQSEDEPGDVSKDAHHRNDAARQSASRIHRNEIATARQ